MRLFARVDFEERAPIDDRLIRSIEERESARFETPVRMYLQEIARVPALQAAEELGLVLAAEAGRDEAKHRLTEARLGLVVSIAGKFAGRGVSSLDLIHEGNIALVRAVKTVRNRGRIDFSASAARSVWRAIVEELAAQQQRDPPPEQSSPRPLPRVLVIEPGPGTVLLARYAADREYIGSTRHASTKEAKEQADFEYAGAVGEWELIPDDIDDAVGYALSPPT